MSHGWRWVTIAAVAAVVLTTGWIAVVERSGDRAGTASPSSPVATTPAPPATSDEPNWVAPGFKMEFSPVPGVPETWARMTATDGSFSVIGAAPGVVDYDPDIQGWSIEMKSDPAEIELWAFAVRSLDGEAAEQAAYDELIRWAETYETIRGEPRPVDLGGGLGWTVSVTWYGTVYALVVGWVGDRMISASAGVGPSNGEEGRRLARVFLSSIRMPA